MNSSIGIFDSGVGGFTVLKRVKERYGNISCIYLGDTARMPYGEKQPSEIRSIAQEVVSWFSSKNISAILVACNTTNSLALDIIKQGSKVPVLGLIQATSSLIQEKRIGVIATNATVASGAYRKEIQTSNPGSIVFEQGCPELVPLIEAGLINSPELRIAAMRNLKPLLNAGIDALVLGCSHYPLLTTVLKDLLPPKVRIIDPAIGLSIQLKPLLGELNHIGDNVKSIANTEFFVTSDPSHFSENAMFWLGETPEVELVELPLAKISSRINIS